MKPSGQVPLGAHFCEALPKEFQRPQDRLQGPTRLIKVSSCHKHGLAGSEKPRRSRKHGLRAIKSML